MTESQFVEFVRSLPRPLLERSITDIYTRLFCNEDGDYIPEESVAAESAADFVDSCNYTFQELLQGEAEC